jgi:hypothetical protein
MAEEKDTRGGERRQQIGPNIVWVWGKGFEKNRSQPDTPKGTPQGTERQADSSDNPDDFQEPKDGQDDHLIERAEQDAASLLDEKGTKNTKDSNSSYSSSPVETTDPGKTDPEKPDPKMADVETPDTLSCELSMTAAAPWPVAEEAMFHGVLGRIVRAIEPHTEADPVGMMVQLLAACGAIIGSTPHTLADGSRHGCNLFTVLVGDTAKGRKGTSWSQVQRVIERIDPEFCKDRIVQGSSSGEGWIEQVRDPVTKLDEKTNRPIVVDEGVIDKRLLVLESELARVLKNSRRETNILSSVMRQAWDNGNMRVMTRTTPAKATGAHIAFIGHITRHELQRLLSDAELFNGFANRILWACVTRSKLLPEGGVVDSNVLQPLVEELSCHIRVAKVLNDTIVRDAEASDLWKILYQKLGSTRAAMGLLGAVTSRSEAQVVRLALLYALLDGWETIQVQHLEAANALWNYCQASAAYVFGHSTGDTLADDLLTRLRLAPRGLSRWAIHEALGRNRSASRINEALRRLVEMKLARCERLPRRTNTTTVWIACR